LTGEFYYANALEKGHAVLVPGRSGYPATTPLANFSEDSATNSRGYGVGGVLAIEGVMFRMAYGAQSNSTLLVTDKGHMVADVGHFETSLGYDTGTGFSFGGFYEQWMTSKQSLAQITNGKVVKVGDAEDNQAFNKSAKSQSSARWSLGVAAESSLVGITHMLQKGDVVVASLGFEQSPINRITGDSRFSKDFDVNSFSASLGYKVDGFLVSGGVEYAMTSQKATAEGPTKAVVFTDNGGKPSKSAFKTLVHLIYYF